MDRAPTPRLALAPGLREKPTSHRESGLSNQQNLSNSGLERNIVIHVVKPRRRLGCRCWPAGRCGSRGARGRADLAGGGGLLAEVFLATVAGACTTATSASAATQQLQGFGHGCGGVLGRAFLVGPLAGAQAAFHIAGTALFQVLAGDLGQAVEEHRAVPFGFFTLF